MTSYQRDLVSIIMPFFNSSKYLEKSIDTVMNQTYTNFELILVDDNSTDNSLEIANKLKEKDERIQLFHLEKNGGAGAARNFAVERAHGEYIAFLDSDDLWVRDKLEKQLKFMIENESSFCCTEYYIINEHDLLIEKNRRVFKIYDYGKLLREGIGNSTVIYNAGKLGKFTIPPVRKRNDYALWLSIIKHAEVLHGLSLPLSYYRKHNKGISQNKLSLLKYHWIVYRKLEKLNLCTSVYLLGYWSIKTAVKILSKV